ncbi:MAG TPA: type II toxin-antitoxin system death-on-curing family toxin [Candidatus Aquilonibacter sp.]|nr:type II toxin-antitoxin system death-on-curing family toxin [Candidatus Aquilonibacter sp.]
MRSPKWVDRRALLLLHAETLAEHGGLAGLRDPGALDASLARPLHLHTYEPESDLARLAAAYAFGIVRSHPFNDGNKRAGFLALGLFIERNGGEFVADAVEAIAVVFRLAESKLTELELAEWIRRNLKKH